MSKDSYWFKHDSSAGRGLKIRTIQHLYDHWGKGIYWDVVEVLRDKSGYQLPADESSLKMLCDLIGCKDFSRFLAWFNDCVKVDLLRKNEVIGSSESGVNSVNFYAPALSETMKFLDKQRSNGSKGGRPELDFPKENEAINPNWNPNTNPKGNPKETNTEHNSTDSTNNLSFSLSSFNTFRVAYPGKKRGNDTEFANFKKKHKDWQRVLPLLATALSGQIVARAHKKSTGGFVPEWKNLPTWINNRCWEEEVELPPSKAGQKPEVTHKQMFPQVD